MMRDGESFTINTTTTLPNPINSIKINLVDCTSIVRVNDNQATCVAPTTGLRHGVTYDMTID